MLKYRSNKLKDILGINLVGRNQYNGNIMWPSCFFPDIVLVTNNNPFKSNGAEKDKERITHIYDL